MARLVLPDDLAQLLESVRIPIAQYLGGEHEMHLGGGAALIARWQHRHSTDVDLFVEPEAYRRIEGNAEQFRADVERLNPDCESVGVSPGFARIILAGGREVSISSSAPRTASPVSGDTVRGTGVSLETTAEILAKKLGYRMIGNGVLVPRDLYDIAYARHVAPAELHEAFSTLRNEQLEDIASELRGLEPDWIQKQACPLIAPANAQDAAGAVHIARRLIMQHAYPRGRGWRSEALRGR